MKQKFYNFLLTKILGWKLKGSIPTDSKKSVLCIAPHTSYREGIIGKVAIGALGINYLTLSAAWLFFFPMKYIMRGLLNAIPVGVKGQNAITTASNALKESDSKHIIICPEGHLSRTEYWSPGFYFIAKKADADINLITFNYKTKTITFKDCIRSNELTSITDVMNRVITAYSDEDTYAYYPNEFVVPKIEMYDRKRNS